MNLVVKVLLKCCIRFSISFRWYRLRISEFLYANFSPLVYGARISSKASATAVTVLTSVSLRALQSNVFATRNTVLYWNFNLEKSGLGSSIALIFSLKICPAVSSPCLELHQSFIFVFDQSPFRLEICWTRNRDDDRLTLSLTRVINFKFPPQPRQKYCITQYEELGFSSLT